MGDDGDATASTEPQTAAAATVVDATVAVPERMAACVEFPGVAQHAERALVMLGGERAVSDALRAPNPALRCHLRPSVRPRRRLRSHVCAATRRASFTTATRRRVRPAAKGRVFWLDAQ